jgi:hypothetical protein
MPLSSHCLRTHNFLTRFALIRELFLKFGEIAQRCRFYDTHRVANSVYVA